MVDPITHVQPPLEFIPPDFNPLVMRVVRSLLPLWTRWRARLVDIEVENAEKLAELYHQFQAGKTRFMIAFRHSSTNDPLGLGHLIWRAVPQVAKQQGIKLEQPIHAHFIYDRGIPLWAGKFVGWLYSRLGGTPIRRGKVDLMGLRSVRHLFANGRFPVAAAPEGATNGHNEIVSPVEPGIAQFGFWCIEDLLKEGRTEQVVILPLGIQYHFVEPPWKSIERLLTRLEIDSGCLKHSKDLPQPCSESDRHLMDSLVDGAAIAPEQEAILYRRLFCLGEYLLSLMEDFYTRFYHQTLSAGLQPQSIPDTEAVEMAIEQPDSTPPLTANQQLSERLRSLLNAALTVAEQYFDLQPKGSLTDRCRRLEQAAWDWIYREDLKQIEALSPVERGLADRVAEEADLKLWHMRLVETFVSVTGHYVIEKPTVDRFADMLLLLWETVTRIKGEVPFPRPYLGRQRVQITVGEPINLSTQWDAYKANRRQAVATITQQIQTALEGMIH